MTANRQQNSALLEPSVAAAPLSKRDERRKAILNVAKKAFLSDGYSATSMSTISARLGGSKATLYNYFSSKEELFTAFVEQECSRTAALYEKLGQDGQDFAQMLREVGQQALEWMLSDDIIGLYRLVAAEAARLPQIGKMYYEAGPKMARQAWAAAFERAAQAGYIRFDDPQIAAGHFFELCLAGLHRPLVMAIIEKPTPDMIKRNVDNAVKVFMAAYGA